ncbi:MAG: hypothetical protein ABW148_18715 [Sedimenticola sp.]
MTNQYLYSASDYNILDINRKYLIKTKSLSADITISINCITITRMVLAKVTGISNDGTHLPLNNIDDTQVRVPITSCYKDPIFAPVSTETIWDQMLIKPDNSYSRISVKLKKSSLYLIRFPYAEIPNAEGMVHIEVIETD